MEGTVGGDFADGLDLRGQALKLMDSLENLKPEDLYHIPAAFSIIGHTGSGKTFFVGSLIHYLREIGYKINVVIFYGTDQLLFDYMYPSEKYKGLSRFAEVVERLQVLDTDPDAPPLGSKERVHNFIIIDDLMDEATSNKEVSNVICRGISHQGLSLALMYQNMLPQHSNAVTIAQNVAYKVFFYNPQSAGQFQFVVRRMDSGKQTLKDMYRRLGQMQPREGDQDQAPLPLVIDCRKHRAWYGLIPHEIVDLRDQP